MNDVYRVQEFAELAGVTVRALHHYGRLTLLKPRRTEAGYRLYTVADLERLEQIVALKFLGLPLKQIKTLLNQDARSLPEVLKAQRRALEEKRRRLDVAIGAIADAERAARPGKQTETGVLKSVLKRIIEVIEMQNNDLKKYYSDGAWAKLAERREQWTSQMQDAQEKASKAWADLFRDIEAALGEDPAGEKAQALAVRWKNLVESFTGGDQGITAGLKKAWADLPNWSPGLKQQAQPFTDKQVWEFIEKAAAARKA